MLFQSGLHQAQPVEYFSKETGMWCFALHENIPFCAYAYHSTSLLPWPSLLVWSMPPPDTHDMVTCAVPASWTQTQLSFHS